MDLYFVFIFLFFVLLYLTGGKNVKQSIYADKHAQTYANCKFALNTFFTFQLQHLTEVESVLMSLTLKNQSLQQDKENLLKEAEERNKKVGSLVKKYLLLSKLSSMIL